MVRIHIKDAFNKTFGGKEVSEDEKDAKDDNKDKDANEETDETGKESK